MKAIPKSDVPIGQSGAWKVERFEIDAAGARLHNLRCAFQPGMGNRTVQPGTYTRLLRGHDCIMSDTDAELRDHFDPVLESKGRILINGLGLGLVLNACLEKPGVTHATVIEKSADVIALVGPHFANKFGDRLAIVHADALAHAPKRGVRFGMVWHDIWDAICGDNLPQMAQLHRRYARRTEWQGSWCKSLCQLYNR